MKQIIAILFLFAITAGQVHSVLDTVMGCHHTTTMKVKACCALKHHTPAEKKSKTDDCCKDDCNPLSGSCGKCGTTTAVTDITTVLLKALRWQMSRVYTAPVSPLIGYQVSLIHPPDYVVS